MALQHARCYCNERMYRVTIIAIGTLKESYWREASAEYEKRLKPYARLTVKELKEESFKDSKDKARILARESEKILAAIPKDSTIIVLDVSAREMSSGDFSQTLQDLGSRGEHLCFVVGGPLGISDGVKAKAQLSLSLSRLTFTHQIARILLLEQLYRVCTIIHHKSYHY